MKPMKLNLTLILILALFFPSPGLTQGEEQEAPGKLELIQTNPNSQTRIFELTWETLPRYTPDFCPIPIEGVVVSGEHDGKLREGDLFSSGFAVDLDGNEVLDDEFRLRTLEHANWGTAHVRNRQFVRPPVRLSESGPSFVVYQYTETEASLGLPLPGYPLGLLSGPNPCLQIMLFEPVEAPGSLPRLELEQLGNRVQTWSRERRLLQDDYGWYSLQWGVIEVQTPYQFAVSGPLDQRAVLLVRSNYAPVDGFRVRGTPILRHLPAEDIR